jgi:hypothetical protein
LIETAFYQNLAGKTPACAIYYIGWNDIINAHIDKLDTGYANYHFLTTPVRRPDLYLAKYSPFVFLLNEVGKNRFDTIPEHPKILGNAPVSGTDKNLEAIFSSNVKSIAAINASRGVKTVFIGQILNKDWPQDPNVWAPLIKAEDFVSLQEHFKSVLQDVVRSSPAKYIDPGIDNFGHGDFVDFGHFTASGTKKFASLISKQVEDYCR